MQLEKHTNFVRETPTINDTNNISAKNGHDLGSRLPQANDTSRNKAPSIFECISLHHCKFEYGCSSLKNSGETQQCSGW